MANLMNRSLLIKLCLLLFGICMLAAVQPAAAEKIVLQLRWYHQFQFAGYYMAAEQGYYRDAGLEVEIRPRTQERNHPLDEVLSGRADFGISDAELVVARSLGKPVVAVAAIFQKSPSVYLALESSGIHSPADFVGKKVPEPSKIRSISLRALLSQENLLQTVQSVASTLDYNKLISGEVDVIAAYRTDQPYQLKLQGYSTNIIDPADYGINFYGDTLFTTEAYIQKNPKRVEKFWKASLRGWQYALAHPNEAVAVIKEEYNSQKTVTELQYEAQEISKIIQAEQFDIGSMDLLRWGKINHHLIALGIISPDFYLTKDFLYEPPQGIPWFQFQEWITGVVAVFILLSGVMIFVSKKNFQLRAIRKQLEKEKEFSTSLIDTAKIIILVLDMQGKIISFNPYLEHLGGYTLTEVKGKDWFTTFLPEVDFEEIHEVFQKVITTSHILGQVNQLITKEGEYLDIEWDNEVLTGSDGEPIGVLAIGRNITDKLKSHEELHRYSQIFSLTGDFMSFIDNNYIYRSVNQAYLDAHNKTFAELIDHSMAEVMGADFFETLIKEKIDRCLAGEKIHYQAWFDFPGGRKKYMDVIYFPYRSGDEKVSGVVVSARDITQLKQLQDEQLQLIQAINQMNDAIVVTNLETEIQYVNPAFERMSGYSVNEAIGKNPNFLQSGRTDQSIYVELWETLTAGDVWHGQLHNRKKDGSLYIEDAIISPVSDSVGNIVNYIAVKRDVTHELEMEEQLRQKYKMEAVGVMAGGMAHNFNNNLAIILGNIELSQLKLPPESEAVPLLKNAKIAVFRSRDLIQKIMTYSRKGAYSKTSILLSEVMDETLKLLQSTIPATINLSETVSMSSRDVAIHGDASQIQEILINLCNNAVHAMDEKGELTLSLDMVDLEQQDISSHSQSPPGCYIKMSIQDNGCGMTAETTGKIFDLFYTTKDVDKGTGVGLSTVRGIVDQHGGMIKVNSILGEGTTFELYFPIIDRRQKERAPVVQKLPRGDEKILFLDDDEMLAKVWSETLREYGYQVSTMMSSTETLKLFTANPDYFDLLITDQTMPDLSGIELIEKLSQIRPGLPTLLCSGYSSKVNADKAKELGISAFCVKPLELPELLQTVRQVLDGS